MHTLSFSERTLQWPRRHPKLFQALVAALPVDRASALLLHAGAHPRAAGR
jgi:hypothetical protein